MRPEGGSLAQSRAATTSTWLDRVLLLRDRLLANPWFQRWAADFPLTRPIAQRRARALFDLSAGFVFSQILLACVQLRVFEALAERPQTAIDLAHRISLPPDAAARLLAAAVSLRLVQRRSRERFGLGSLGAALVGNPSVTTMIDHHRLFYADLRDPVALLRGDHETELSRYWRYARHHDPAALATAQVSDYTELMSASQPLIAQDIIDSYPLHRHRCLLDVGGGDGTFAAAAAGRAVELRLILFDLPAVADQARRRFVAQGLTDRATAIGGDFLRDPLPRGADIVSMVRVIHDHDDAAALKLLRAIRLVLPQDGVVLIAEPMSGTRGAEPIGDAYFGFYLLAVGCGRPRTPNELKRLLKAAGFGRTRLIPTRRPFLSRVIEARRFG